MRRGFTLMELLLVVAILAIVAAAAAPTFFGGASEAMNEAKRSAYLSAYTNTMSGASVYVSLKASKGEEIAAGSKIALLELNKYVPVAARTFNNGTTDITLGAMMGTGANASQTIVFYGAGTEANPNASWTQVITYTSATY